MQAAAARLLAVFDGSSLTERALRRAVEIALERRARLTVLVVTPPRLWRGRRAQFDIPLESRDDDFARAQVARAKEICGALGIRAAGRLRSGPPVDVIVDEVSRGYDLVVIGDRGSLSGAKTVGERVREHVPCEVLLLR
ncbi:MAG: universal stress protein [Acidobacteria bacterium]|nr:universal stress protein [Acidobacteriota bacterium]